MFKILILSQFTFANCISQLAADTGYSQEQVTHILMSCNNQLLFGQTIFLNNHKKSDKLIRKYYPKTTQDGDASVTEQEKANRLLDYSKCEEISRNLKIYMKKCEK